MTTGEISAHLAEVYGGKVSRQTISTTTGKPVCTAPTQAAARERFGEAWGARYPAIESVNARIRRAVKARGHFPNEQAALNAFDGRLTAGRK